MAKGSRGRMQYGDSRTKAIQRATQVPKTTVLQFVIDKTFSVEPPALPTGTDPMVTSCMNVSMNNLTAPMDAATTTGVWTAQEGAVGDSVEGLDNWVGTDGRYQTYLVLGAKIEVESTAGRSATSTTPYVPNYAIGIHKATTGLTDVTGATQLPTIQKMAYTQVRNLRGNHNEVGDSVQIQGGRLSDTYSAKRWEGVTDVKDNKDLRGTSAAPPVEGGKFQVFLASRAPKSTGQQVPAQLMRIKVSYVVLLSDPKTKDNDPLAGAMNVEASN